jgi:hypothetical protein
VAVAASTEFAFLKFIWRCLAVAEAEEDGFLERAEAEAEAEEGRALVWMSWRWEPCPRERRRCEQSLLSCEMAARSEAMTSTEYR